MDAKVASSVLDDRDRRRLLTELAGLGSDADAHDDILRVFLALPSHSQALRPSALVVRGERGAGKTALFHALREIDRRGIAVDALFPGAPSLPTRWLEGFSERGKEHPSTQAVDAFGEATPADGPIRAFWFGHLVGVLARAHPDHEAPPAAFMERWRRNRADPAAWVPEVRPNLGALSAWLDRLDDRCMREGRRVVVTYDHLDKIGITRPRLRARFASTLLAMWLSLANRYDGLGAKIFLREDLFEASLQGSADASKLETRSVSLRWSAEDLYRVLIRHMASRDGLRRWLATPPNPVPLARHDSFGWMPPEALPEEGDPSQHTLAARLAGELMGKGVKKGYTHRWIPNHLKDAHGAIVPRSILNLVAFAARYALHEGPRARESRLLHPVELQAALENTSRYRVAELAEEHRVVRRLENLRGMVLLASRRELVARLRKTATREEDGFGDDGEAVFEELVRLGVLKVRPDGRVDIPDIYRYGFGIKRKGGVARPR